MTRVQESIVALFSLLLLLPSAAYSAEYGSILIRNEANNGRITASDASITTNGVLQVSGLSTEGTLTISSGSLEISTSTLILTNVVISRTSTTLAADTATTADYATTALNFNGTATTATYATSAGSAGSASTATTATFASNATTATYVTSATFGDLTDVDLTGLVNNNIPKYNSTTGKWEPASAAGVTVPNLQEVTDEGNSTTQTISIAGYTFPSADGTTSQALLTDGAGALYWGEVAASGGGSWALVDSETVSVATADVTFTGISGDYDDLVVIGRMRSDVAGNNASSLNIRLGNGTADSGSNYNYSFYRLGTSSLQSDGQSQTAIYLNGSIPAGLADSGAYGYVVATVFDYASTGYRRVVFAEARHHAKSTANYLIHGLGEWLNTSDAVTVVELTSAAGNWDAGTYFELYGRTRDGGSGGGGGGTPTLQQVIVQGNTTTGTIYTTGLSVNGQLFPAADGTSSQSLYTDGAGGLYWDDEFTAATHDTHDHSTALGTAQLDDLSDVIISGPAQGDFLSYNGAEFASGNNVLASTFNIIDPADGTKQIEFAASGITTGNTRTFTAPDKDGTLAVTSDLSAYEPTISAGTTAQYWRGDKSWQSLDTAVDALGYFDATSHDAHDHSTALGTAVLTDLSDVGASGIDTANIKDDAVTAGKLADTAVTPGSYTSADITVDAQGRITAASNGSGGLSISGTDNRIVRMDGTTGIQDSAATIADTGDMSLGSGDNLTLSGGGDILGADDVNASTINSNSGGPVVVYGNIDAPGVYFRDVNGTNEIQVWVGDSGELGYDSSAENYYDGTPNKINKRALTNDELTSLAVEIGRIVQRYDRANNNRIGEIGAMAAEMDAVGKRWGVPGLVTYHVEYATSITLNDDGTTGVMHIKRRTTFPQSINWSRVIPILAGHTVHAYQHEVAQTKRIARMEENVVKNRAANNAIIAAIKNNNSLAEIKVALPDPLPMPEK